MVDLNEKELEHVRNLIAASRRDTYERLMDHRKSALELQGHYGKWLVSSLLLIHGATIGFISQSDRLSEKLMPGVFTVAVAGLIFALVCGFITWLNWGLNFRVFDSVNPAMVLDDDYWPDLSKHPTNKWINASFWGSLGFGFLSVFCIILGAYLAAATLGPAT